LLKKQGNLLEKTFWRTGLFFALTLFLFLPKIVSQSEPSIEENIFQSSLNLHQWGTISSFNGLPSERVNAITQTPDGLLWFGTDNGLARFDGRRVQTNMATGISSLRILALQTDSDGTLWVGTEKGAFYYTDNFFQPLQETADYSINSIYFDGEDVFLGDIEGTIFKTRLQNKSERTELLIKSETRIKNLSGKDKKLIIGTSDSGLSAFEDNQIRSIITRPRPFSINVLAKDSDENLWIGATSSIQFSGLFLAENLPDLKIVGKNLGTVNSIAFGQKDEVWVGTDNRGSFSFEGTEFRKRFTFENTSGGLRSNKILSTFVDREGVIWFGTDKGVSRYDPKSPRNERISEDIQSNFVRTLYQTKNGQIYVGTNRGLFNFNEKTNVWKSIENFRDRRIYTISENENENVLIGTRKGLFEKKTSVGSFATEQIVDDESIRAIEKFQNKIYLASFGQGVLELKKNNPRLIHKASVISLNNEDNKALWMGTINEGVFVFDGQKTVSTGELDELKTTAIRKIAGNQADGIWFATDKGLYLFKDNELQIILAEQNARDIFVERDEEEQLRIWCATETGLFNLIYDENFGWISSRIEIEQGLSSQNIFALLPIKSNYFLLGTNRGVIRYQTSQIRPFLIANRILSQRIHQTSELERGITLNYPQNSLSVEVTAISSRTFSEQFQYAFLLFDGKNKLIDKKFSEDGQFLMDNLDPDRYRIEIRAFDKNLLASEPLVFNITVEQAPFPLIATVLAVLLLIALAALMWAVFSQQKTSQTTRELANANRELNNARLNLANEAERERHRISRDLHDQTLADLRHLLLMADEVPSEKASEFRTEIESVSDEIRRICEDLSPSVLENIGFAAALEWALGSSVEQVSNENKIEYEFIGDDDLEENLHLSSPEQIQIYRIAQEVLSNIVRHSEATKITMNANLTAGKKFLLTIKDNGKGFELDKSKKGRGLANINARAKLIEAGIEWKNLPDERGMLFNLRK
jgi:signal transduction histidine kinase/ligand-binding sensor domain-containing protein